MRVLSGVQPSGTLHIGNYFGAIRQYIELQDQAEEAFYFIANLHALTTVRDAIEGKDAKAFASAATAVARNIVEMV